MKRSVWAVAGVVLFFIGLLVAYAFTPPGESGAKKAPAATRDAH
jgi:hypothetical protein